MDLRVKNKRVFLLCSVFILLLLSITIIFTLRNYEKYQNKYIKGTIIEIYDDYVTIYGEEGAEYIISLDTDYKGVSLSSLSEADFVKVWYKGEIAETDPMQIVADKIETY